MFSSWPNSSGMWRVTKKFFDLPHSRLQSLFLVHRGSRSQLLCLIHWISYRWSSLLMTARSHFPSQKAACPTQEHICPSFQHHCCPALFIGPTEGRCQHFVQLESPDTPEPVRCWLGQSFLGGVTPLQSSWEHCQICFCATSPILRNKNHRFDPLELIQNELERHNFKGA